MPTSRSTTSTSKTTKTRLKGVVKKVIAKLRKQKRKAPRDIGKNELLKWVIKRFHRKRKGKKGTRKTIAPGEHFGTSGPVMHTLSTEDRTKPSSDELTKMLLLTMAHSGQARLTDNSSSSNPRKTPSRVGFDGEVGDRGDEKRPVAGHLEYSGEVVKSPPRPPRPPKTPSKPPNQQQRLPTPAEFKHAGLNVEEVVDVYGKEVPKAYEKDAHEVGRRAQQQTRREDLRQEVERNVKDAGVAAMRAAIYDANEKRPDDKKIALPRPRVTQLDKLKDIVRDNPDVHEQLYRNIERKLLEEEPKYAILRGSGRRSKGLYSDEIDQMMAKVKGYQGACSADRVRLTTGKTSPQGDVCWIVNLDTHGKPGSHWTALLITSHSIEFYNSFGDHAPDLILNQALAIARKLYPDTPFRIKENLIKQQNLSSYECGWFAMRFLIDRIVAKKSFEEATGFKLLRESMVRKSEAEIKKFKEQFPKFKLL